MSVARPTSFASAFIKVRHHRGALRGKQGTRSFLPAEPAERQDVARKEGAATLYRSVKTKLARYGTAPRQGKSLQIHLCRIFHLEQEAEDGANWAIFGKLRLFRVGGWAPGRTFRIPGREPNPHAFEKDHSISTSRRSLDCARRVASRRATAGQRSSGLSFWKYGGLVGKTGGGVSWLD